VQIRDFAGVGELCAAQLNARDSGCAIRHRAY
jgi:hypothetical protein